MSRPQVIIEEELKDIIPFFVTETQKDFVELQGLVDTSNLAGVSELAHRLKGECGGYGFDKLSELALEVEKAAKAGDGSKLSELVDQMVTYLAEAELRLGDANGPVLEIPKQ
ncbi:MAG: hypothetical protein CL675_08295 [Bdellovibrionaceae bacterium]|nr:hypothetical protein [Pseudobdellovibrionaceae bacterium]